MKKVFIKQISALALALIILLGWMPGGLQTAKAAAVPGTITTAADPGTVNNWKSVFGNDTDHVGGVWTDKSVFTSTAAYISATDETENAAAQAALHLKDENNFLVALSAVSSTKTVKGYSTKPTDTILILDLSGSMKGSTGTMVQAANKAIGDLLALNSHNRVGVVLFSGNSQMGDSNTSTAEVLMPLNRYTTTATTRVGSQTLPLFIQANSNEKVTVSNQVQPRTGLSDGKNTSGGTYTQNGIYQAMNQLVNATDKRIPEGSVQAGMIRIPIMVLMTDGEPTAASKAYTNIQTSNVGTGSSSVNNKSDMAFLTQLTAAYAKREIETAYGVDSRFYTLGYGVGTSAEALCVLDPGYANTPNRVKELWTTFNSTAAGGKFNIKETDGNNESVTKHTDPSGKYEKELKDYRYYTDRYFPANQSSDLSAAFQSIVDEIVLQSMYYPTLVDGNVHTGGYIEFHDYIGSNMEVLGVKGLQMGANLYTGQQFARQMITSSGTAGNPTELGDNLVWAVRERLQLTGENDITLAREIIGKAYRSGQLAYSLATGEFSNYIGWYSDKDGKYIDWWDGGEVDKTKSGAKYAVKSYFFLDTIGGGQRMTDTLYAMIQVRTDLATDVQEVHVKLPASLIPLVQYNIELNGSTPTDVKSVTRDGTSFPVRLVYEVGLSSQIDLLDLKNTAPRPIDLETEYTTQDDHGNKDSQNGGYVFYTNEWQRGLEHDDADHLPGLGEYNTHMFFQPSQENEHYYYHEDTPVYKADGTLYTGSSAPTGDGCYRIRYIYHTDGSAKVTTEYEPIPASALAHVKKTDAGWSVEMGTVFRTQTRAPQAKTKNETATLGHSEHSAVHNDGSLPYHIDAIHGNNGKLTLTPYQGVKVTKQLISPLTHTGPYTFVVKAQGVDSALLIKEAGGVRAQSTLSFANGEAAFELNAGETAWVLNLPAGTSVTIEEAIPAGALYEVASVNGEPNDTYTGTIEAGEISSALFANREVSRGQMTIAKNVVSTIDEHKTSKSFEFEIQMTGVEAGATFPAVMQNGTLFTLTAVLENGKVCLKNGTANVTLKHLENLTIKEIPDGTTATVTEINLPGGFTPDANGKQTVINKGDRDTLTFTNTYQASHATQANIDIIGTKTLTVPENTGWTGQFDFVLSKQDENKNWVQVSSTGSTSTASVSYTNESGDKTFTALNLFGESFNAPGTYSYRVHENVPASPESGILYDVRNCYFDVVVTDDGNGQLVISDVAPRADTVVTKDEANNQWVVNVAFANKYVLNGAAKAVLGVKKEITSASGVVIPPDGFQFGLYQANEQYVIDETVEPILSAFTSSAGLANIGVTYQEQDIGTHYYVLKEIVPPGGAKATANGTITYGSTSYNVKVQVGHDDGKFTISLTVEGHDPVTGHASAAEDVVTAEIGGLTFTNTYEPTPVTLAVPLTGRKILEGREITAEDNFVIDGYKTDNTFQIVVGAQPIGYGEVQSTGNGWYFEMRPQTYEKTGIYYYVLKERLPEAATAENGFTVDGVTYDLREYHVTIEVTGDNNTGKLSAQVISVVQADVKQGVEAIVFRNRYTTKPATHVKIEGTKTLNGSLTLQAGMFTFELYEADETFAVTGEPVKTTQNLYPNGNTADFAFTMSYDQAGIYRYVVKEQIPTGDNGIQYDMREHHITVTVRDDGKGQLTASVDSASETVAFTNSYVPDPVTSAAITGTKALTGDMLAAGEFTFELWQARKNSSGNVSTVGHTALQKVANKADGTFRFEPIQFSAVGDYWFIVKETIGTDPATVYDASLDYVLIRVRDDLKGKLTAEMEINGSAGSSVMYINERHPMAAEAVFTGTKTLTNASLIDKQFTFELYEAERDGSLVDDAPILTAQNSMDGSFLFQQSADKELTYTREGTWYYVIRERIPAEVNRNGIVYDDGEYLATVQVTKESINGRDTFVPAITYKAKTMTGWKDAAQAVFNNTYAPQNGKVIIEGQKVFRAGPTEADGEKLFAEGAFAFDLIRNGSVIDTANVNADGSFAFNELTFTNADIGQTFVYTVKEKAGNDTQITYDLSAFTVSVSVEQDPENDKLLKITKVTHKDDEETGLEFTNIFKPQPISYQIKARKSYNKPLQGNDFTFELSGEGFETQTVKNDASGMVAFAPVAFEHAGEYVFTVKETNQILSFINYSKAEYSVTAKVINTDGVLSIQKVNIEKIKGTENENDLIFINAYELTNPHCELILTGTKTLTGRSMNTGEFSFGLYDVNGTLIDSALNDAQGRFSFKKLTYEIEAGQTGEYQYTVREIAGNDPTIAYDSTVYNVDVIVSDNNQGGAQLAYTINGNAEGELAFANIYTPPKAVQALLTIQKAITGKNAAAISLKDFIFVLANGDKQLEAASDANGLACFQLTFDADDIGNTYEFKICEKPGLIFGMTYDPTVYTVVIHVGQNADGSLALTINGKHTDSVKLTFTNTYAPVLPPATGDHFPVTLLSAMMLMSAAGAASIMLRMRRKQNG